MCHLHPDHESEERRKSVFTGTLHRGFFFFKYANISVVKFKITNICICISQCYNKYTKEMTSSLIFPFTPMTSEDGGTP